VIRIASRDDLPRLRELFARANDGPYDLAAVAEEKCFGRGIAGEPVVRVIGDIDAAAVTCGKFLRLLVVDREHRGKGLGTALLGHAQMIAAEPGNYFTPGIVTTDLDTIAFLKKRGYVEGATTTNLEVSLRVDSAPEAAAATLADAERVLAFIEREFGRIWRFEASHAFDVDPPTLFFAEHDGEIAGFAAHDVNNRGLGWFGPTGVKKSLRGLGIGRRLLLASLADLQRLGYSKAVIPWTDAIDFYRRSCGAEPAHRFVAFARAATIDSAP
jgi:GNAT superfamily N-acetyltransferase